ncbi:MAG: molybdopterin-binding protein [Pirellulales bacterium]
MNAEVISIGDELTSGQRLDTNSQWLSQQLGDVGVRVLYHSTVADDMAAIVAVFAQAVARADVVLVTGGLGPTADDLTREAIAQLAAAELVLDEPSLTHIRGIFARYGREMPERNEVQAYLPRGATAIHNQHGTAPGVAITVERDGHTARLYAMPGVPAEMYEMFTGQVLPQITAAMPAGGVIRHRAIKCFGQGESAVEAMLPDLIRRGRQPSVGITVSKATITLRITAHATDEAGCLAQIAPTEQTIRECLGDLVFGSEQDELQDAVIRLLVERRQSLAVAEWGTQGLVTHWLQSATAPRDTDSDTPPSNAHVLHYAVVANSTEELCRGIGSSATDHDPATDAGLEALATQLREAQGADLALVVGPLTSPHDDSAASTSDPPRIPCAVAHPGGVALRRPQYAGPPDMRLERCAKHAVDLLRLCLLGNT